MSVNIDIRGEGVRPTLKTSRMSLYLSDTGIGQNICILYYRSWLLVCIAPRQNGGAASSLGLRVSQINAGLYNLFGIEKAVQQYIVLMIYI